MKRRLNTNKLFNLIEMKFYHFLVLAFITIFAPLARSADEVKLEPNARWHLYFPDLPDTLAVKITGQKQPTQLTAKFPSNYSTTGKFPIFLFIDGSDGGFGDRLALDQRTIGTNDFICVNLPLFKTVFPGTDGGLITMEDYETLSHVYQVMLQKLFDTVPNITPERSAIGGFSNGAHAVGVLLARRDKFIFEHFQSFFLVEGGFGSFAATAATSEVVPELKKSRVLLLYGDHSNPGDDPDGWMLHDYLARACVVNAKQNHYNLTSVVMRGYGHAYPPQYTALTGSWVRGEPLPEIEK
jgi:hypothetical protein